MTGTRVAGLVLAAGAGVRFGGPKALAEVGGERLVDRAVRTLGAAGLDPVLVVTGAAEVAVEGALVVPNPDWAEGMGGSLRAGLAALAATDAVAVAVLLVDQPGVTAAAVARVVGAVRDEQSLVVATYGGQRGHPVVLGRAHWASAARLAVGDQGARALLAAHADLVVTVECADVASGEDIDTPDQLARWSQR